VLIVLVVLLLTAVAAVFLVIKANATPGESGAGHAAVPVAGRPPSVVSPGPDRDLSVAVS
jgi:hypothetical protein